MEKRTTSVFVAGADDCDDLRDIALEVFEALNTGKTHEFVVFDWRHHTDFDNFSEFQEGVFASARERWGKNKCDILVLLLWTKFGKHTKAEYDKYMLEFEDNTERPKLAVCHYNGEVRPLSLEKSNIQSLFSWKRKVAKSWGEIHTIRGDVQNHQDFRKAFLKRMSEYKDRILEGR